jgi:hypothetical protein
LRAFTCVALSVLAVPVMEAQDTTRAVACAGQRIDSIYVHSAAPSVAIVRRVPIVAGAVRALHVTTRPDIIRRFTVLRTGQACDELRRAESERILRAQPFLAAASVQTFSNDLGGVDVDVRTIDEISVLLGGSVYAHAFPLRSLQVGNANINGEAIYLAGGWHDGGAYRDGFGARLVDNQLLGRPYTFTLEGRREPLGEGWRIETAHPFITGLQRIAWRGRTGAATDYIFYPIDEDSAHGVRVYRNFFDAGGIVRVGPPARLSLFGASISGENEVPAAAPVLVTSDGLRSDTSTLLRDRFTAHRIARLNALWGVRDIGFVRVHGFDALNATQDLPVGLQLGAMFGRSLQVLGTRDDDVFLAGDLYVGAGGPRAALRFQTQAEGRYSNDESAWDGILTSGIASEYVRITSGNTLIASLEWSGGWSHRTPFNLSLGDPIGGIPGYGGSLAIGARRLVERLENRRYFGRVFGVVDLGAAAFVNAGTLWAGDIPYGTNTPVEWVAGVSLLGAVPPGSARLWRLDLAFPFRRETGVRQFSIRFSALDKTPFFFREPEDVQATRERTVPSSVFRWP